MAIEQYQTDITPGDKEKLKQLTAQCFASSMTAAKVWFPDRFDMPFSQTVHKPVLDLIDSGAQKIVIAGMRGMGKTSIVDLVVPAQKILSDEKKYVVMVGSTFDNIVEQTENLKYELQTNKRLVSSFGPTKGSYNEGVFAKKRWIASNNAQTMVFPRGAGQPVRGMLYRNARPDLIIVDDLEKTDEVMSDDQRRKLKKWFYGDLLNCVNRRRNDWQIIVIGTILHEDSLLVNLLQDPTWSSIKLGLCDTIEKPLKSSHPDYMTDGQVRKLYAEFEAAGEEDVFATEFCNLPIDPGKAVFQQKFWINQRYKEPNYDLDQRYKDLCTVILVDPAKTVKPTSDFTAIVGVSIRMSTGDIYVRDIVAARLFPDQMYAAILGMAERLKTHNIGIEVTSLHEFITQPFEQFCVKEKFPAKVIELKPKGRDKKFRINALRPYYVRGSVWHNSAVCNALEAQLLMHPKSQRDDIADALAYVVGLMEVGQLYPNTEGEWQDFETVGVGASPSDQIGEDWMLV